MATQSGLNLAQSGERLPLSPCALIDAGSLAAKIRYVRDIPAPFGSDFAEALHAVVVYDSNSHAQPQLPLASAVPLAAAGGPTRPAYRTRPATHRAALEAKWLSLHPLPDFHGSCRAPTESKPPALPTLAVAVVVAPQLPAQRPAAGNPSADQ